MTCVVETEACLRSDAASQPISPPDLSTRVAVLKKHKYQSSVTYHNLQKDGLISDVLGYSYLRDIADEGKKQSPGKQHARIVQAYSKIHSLLSPRVSGGKGSSTNTQQKNDSRVLLKDKRCAFIERLEPPPNSKADIVNTVFAQVNLQPADGPSFDQFVNCRSSNIKANDLKNSEDGITRPITISTGICLFSSGLLGFIPTNGLSTSDNPLDTVIPPLPDSKIASFYELETCVRMANTIAGLAVTACTGGTAGSRPVVVRLDVPRLQYYCYPLELLQAGLVGWEYVQEWFRLVDRRRRQVASLLKDTILHEVRRRGCDVRVEVTAGTIAATELLRLCVLDRRDLPSVDDMLFVLKWIGPYQTAWREFLDIVDDSQKPKDIRGLALMAYVFEVLYPALHQATNTTLPTEGKETGRPLLIQVDDIAEWRIFDRAEKLVKRFKQRQHGLDPLLVGVFPSPRIFTNEEQGRSTLFLHDPGLKISQTRSSSVVSPLDIIGRIYGQEIQDTLVRLIIERGLSTADEL